MALDGPKVVKASIIGFAVLFLVTGLALLIFGITITTPFGEYFTLKGNAFPVQLGLRIGLIFLVLIISGLTIFAAIKENNRILTIIAILYVILLITEFSLGIAYFTLRSEGIKKTSTSANGLQLLSIYGEKESVTNAIDQIQTGFQCCGITDYRDWFTSGWAARQGVTNRVPSSCCKVPAPMCGWDMDIKNPVDVINIIGCTGLNYSESYSEKIIGGAGLGLAFMHLLSILACAVFCCCFNTLGGLSPVDALKGKKPENNPGGNSSGGPSRSGRGGGSTSGGSGGGSTDSGPSSAPQQRKKKTPAFKEPFDDDDDLPGMSTQDLLDKSRN